MIVTPFQETLKELFCSTLKGEYIELKHAASFRIERKGDTLYLFFEKSNGKEDWRNNLDFPARPYRKRGEVWFVHRGFLRVFQEIKPYLAAPIRERSVKNIVLSGYSHGAALCLLAHEYAISLRPDLFEHIHGFGFGCPRVVFGYLKKSIAARFKNFTVVKNRNDLITHLPPAIFGYRHVGKTLLIGSRALLPIEAHRAESYLKSLSFSGGKI